MPGSALKHITRSIVKTYNEVSSEPPLGTFFLENKLLKGWAINVMITSSIIIVIKEKNVSVLKYNLAEGGFKRGEGGILKGGRKQDSKENVHATLRGKLSWKIFT